MPACDHEEADTRLLIHLQDALLNGCTNCMVRTVDTDVVVILLGKFHHLLTLCQDVKIWVAFGTGKTFTYHHINLSTRSWVERNPWLSLFSTVSRDVTPHPYFLDGARSLPGRHGTAILNPDVTQAFTYMALHPYIKLEIEDKNFKLLERFTIILYDKSSDIENVNEARKELFCQKNKTMEKLPPTRDALLQHS